MTDSLIIDKAHARRFVLSHLGLYPPRTLRGKQGVLDFVRRVNCIQYDPINVVGQNPHLVLQSRVRDYKPAMLDTLLYKDRKLVDGFDKMMAIYPVEDWPQFNYYRLHMAEEYMPSEQTAAAAELVGQVRKEIEQRGPLSSLDFKEDTRMDWWLAGSVRAVRIALDLLFYSGETVVHHRVGTRRYFDLSRRVLPPELLAASRPHASHEEYMDWHLYRRAGGLALANSRVNAGYGAMLRWQGGRIKAAIKRLVKQGRLLPLSIGGIPKREFYLRHEDLPALEAAAKTPRGPLGAALIAPLDNLMWDRDLDEKLFDFPYAWEVYIPATRRKYGYYVMPVLYGDQLVARMDPEFDRKSQTFNIKGWWWEDGVDKKDEAMLAALQECLAAFGSYLGADAVRLGEGVKRQPGLARAVKGANQA